MENGNQGRRVRKGKLTKQAPGVNVPHAVLGKSHVWFTRHALERMKERHVTQAVVFSVLHAPSKKGLPTQPGRERWRKVMRNQQSVDVVFVKWPSQICIVTVIVL